ncbi:ABC-type cobalamin/Fe3+-siderophores transport system, ATPase component [Sanguibacter gelidistatuariae]|uniref:ABC-type cobalamin/Fe3+-siderophores transport system, ATPase component n=1 Tax=Sanguibacter gelidistatuariae TaxID=1814289 RepID=A0A1G6HK09_9MICO|nr:ATP-binding cassette domain-containing protein [Sanguibacter gelidistatuariae]SDB94245.1 ABC-type cobalamin/Fe3+-siderophores transport system, ATPase component [Sanguibacter gelidistatuariae]
MNQTVALHASDAVEATPTTPAQPTPTTPAQPVRSLAIRARALTLEGARGLVYGPLDLDVLAGDLIVLQGPQGAGRSSLLLTLAGRMVPSADSRLTLLGTALPARRGEKQRRQVQRRAAIAGFTGIDELDDAVTIADTIRERLAWLSPWHRRTPAVTEKTYAALADPVFGPRTRPALDSMVWDLDEVDAMLLRIMLAMAQGPELLLVDDLDQVHDSARRQLVWDRLHAITTTGVTVIGSVASAGEVGAMVWPTAPTTVSLTTGPLPV